MKKRTRCILQIFSCRACVFEITLRFYVSLCQPQSSDSLHSSAFPMESNQLIILASPVRVSVAMRVHPPTDEGAIEDRCHVTYSLTRPPPPYPDGHHCKQHPRKRIKLSDSVGKYEDSCSSSQSGDSTCPACKTWLGELYQTQLFLMYLVIQSFILMLSMVSDFIYACLLSSLKMCQIPSTIREILSSLIINNQMYEQGCSQYLPVGQSIFCFLLVTFQTYKTGQLF